MTREEEIQKLIDEETGIDNYGSSDYQIGVCDGVRLADKTMLEKVCKYLKSLVYQEFAGGPLEQTFSDEDIEDFRKAMEE